MWATLGWLRKAGQQNKDEEVNPWSWTLRLSPTRFQGEPATEVPGYHSDALKFEVIVHCPRQELCGWLKPAAAFKLVFFGFCFSFMLHPCVSRLKAVATLVSSRVSLLGKGSQCGLKGGSRGLCRDPGLLLSSCYYCHIELGRDPAHGLPRDKGRSHLGNGGSFHLNSVGKL